MVVGGNSHRVSKHSLAVLPDGDNPWLGRTLLHENLLGYLSRATSFIACYIACVHRWQWMFANYENILWLLCGTVASDIQQKRLFLQYLSIDELVPSDRQVRLLH